MAHDTQILERRRAQACLWRPRKKRYKGAPLCEHNNAPRSTFDDLTNEVAGLELNEHFWEVVDGAGEDVSSCAGVRREVADRLVSGDWGEYRNDAFLNHVGERTHDCLDALRPLASERGVGDDRKRKI